jgi:Zn-dependent peptidase ImmA (M78 family)
MMKVSSGIMALAEEIAARYEEPIPLEKVAEDELLEVICDDYGKGTFDGLTWFEPETEDFYIHLNTNADKANYLNKPKGRFTMAHELGHYYIPAHRLGLMSGKLSPHGSLSFINNLPAWQIEREADAFASSLLMPSYSIGEFIKGKQFNFQLIEAIADKYNVSISAAALRFVDIGNYPIMVVFAVDGKIRWVSHSADFPFWRLRYGNGNGDKVPEYTVMGTYFYEHYNGDCKSEETVYAKDCFYTCSEEDNKREFKEWCIDFHNCALSVFWEK